MATDHTDEAHQAGATSAEELLELDGLAELTAHEASIFLTSVTEVASGTSPDTALPVLTLALSQMIVAGARLGAIQDVVLVERFEADAGPDEDVDPLRDGLANVLSGIDEYVDIVDPLTSGERAVGSISGDVADVALALTHGLKHFAAGRRVEALWWWQFSYLSAWGDRATASLRALQSILSHVRLDADDEAVGEAEFDALYP
ncbi:MAG: DUF5063 domain-containing protein [Terracoccus sp.]